MPDRDPIAAVLGPGGALAACVPGYEHRAQQIDMARKVFEALTSRCFLLAEAGTGTGKTLAYLVPVVLSGRRVVVSTATKNLQEQIAFKDVPLVQEALGADVPMVVLKGRSNYLCKHKIEAFAAAPDFRSRADAKRWPHVLAWARSTQTGDRAEIDLPDDSPLWSSVSTTARACLGSDCPMHDECFVTRRRAVAREAKVVVVNHHLLFADLAVREATGDAKGVEVIPAYDAVIFDEAHALADAATAFFAIEFSPLRVAELARDAEALQPFEDARAGQLARILEKARDLSAALFRDLAASLAAASDRAARIFGKKLAPFGARFDELAQALSAARGLLGGSEEAPASALVRRAGDLEADLGFVRRADDPAYVYWLEARERAAFLKAAPIDVAKELKQRFYPRVDTAIFTSATLATCGRFDFTRTQLGLAGAEPRTIEIAVDSPFDYRRQAALFVDPAMPEPASEAAGEAVAGRIAELCAVTGGRAFCLFTSLRAMKAAHDRLAPGLAWPALLQGTRPKAKLLDAFRARPSVLFASASFWEGVDVPGEALSLVIIDKLPFASPSDPVVSARVDFLKGQDRDPFAEYQLPEAVLALRQGFGRLIRTRTDRGIVAVLDPRILTKPYGQTFLASLPPCPRFGDVAALQAWWGSGPDRSVLG